MVLPAPIKAPLPAGAARTTILRVLALWAVLLVMGARAGSAGAAEVGAVSDITWGTSRAEIVRTVALMQEAGVRWTRVNLSWSGGEPAAKGRLNEGWLAQVDYAVAKARSAGIEVLMPVADGVPYWASADPRKHRGRSGERWNKYYRPSDPAEYADFVRRMVHRYSAQGVHAYEVWNEPNRRQSWPPRPNAAQYTRLLRAGAAAIRQADPSATVVLGGLSESDSAYMEQLYEGGAGPHFDVAAIHPYTGSADPGACWVDSATQRKSKDAFCGIEAVHDVMAANGDGDKKLWLTEFGWSSATAPGTDGVGEALQAAYLSAAFAKLETYSYVDKAFWYGMRNTYWLRDDPSQWEANAGLLRTDFSPKPAYLALKDYAARWARTP